MFSKKPQTLVILGRHPAISVAEIRSRFPQSKICARENEFAIFENLKDLDLKKIGGVVKAGKVFSHSLNFPIVHISEFLEKEFQSKTGKQNFAISLFPEQTKTLKTLLVGAKKFLRDRKISVRFANKNFTNLTSAQSEFEILKKKGVEILVVNSGKNWWLAKLDSVQPFQDYKFRDYEKKFRDARVGMLPPKLAQMIVNLAVGNFLDPRLRGDDKMDSAVSNSGSVGTDMSVPYESPTVYDPFCGSGGILVEAGLLGYKILGSDVDPRMIEFTQKNLAEFKISGDVFLHDARQNVAKKFDVVATEGYLGPPRRTLPDEKMRTKIFAELESLYADFFRWLDCKRVVICFPVYLEHGKPKYFASKTILPAIAKLGWKMQNAEKLIYARGDQVVGREVVVLERT